MKTYFFLMLGFVFVSFNLMSDNQSHSTLVSINETNKVVLHTYTPKGDVLPDFSFCGYKGGGVSLPIVKTIVELSPQQESEDDTPRIQAALDKVGKVIPNSDGFRGAVLLKKGTYRIASTLKINNSGIVLRGEGYGNGETLLIGTTPEKYSLISIGNTSKFKIEKNSRSKIIDNYVPSGTSVFTVKDISKFSIGDNVIIDRESSQNWISFIGMDKIEQPWTPITDFSEKNIKKLKDANQIDEQERNYTKTEQWVPGSKNIKFERKIIGITNNRITVDIPITNAIQSEFGGGELYKYSCAERISQVGIENLAAVSLYDSTVVGNLDYLKGYFADENHAWTFIEFNSCENVWARDLKCTFFSMGFRMHPNCKYATIQDCQVLDPVSIIVGGRRYGYLFGGQMCLVKRCYSRNCRHDFVLDRTVAGPNVFLDSKAELSHAASEPHQRWATGCLWDNCEVSGPQGYISLSNRGAYGTGHGWSGAQMVLWNCKTPLAVVMAPPTAMNFSIGTTTMKTDWSDVGTITDLVKRINKISGKNFKYIEGLPTVGDGFVESQNKFVFPQSLYKAQLISRLGEGMLKELEK